MGGDIYLIFAFDEYYPSGGMHDNEGVFTELSKATTRFDELTRENDWGNIELVRIRDGAFTVEKIWKKVRS